jgi:UDPglucose 6-dehydrogenase
MKITVIGAGYVGLVTAACLANLGNEVICMDIDKKRISMLNKGEMPLYEPGLEEMVRLNVKAKRLYFKTDAKKAIQQSEIIFIAVGTPSKDNGEADLNYIFSVAKTIGKYMNDYKVIVDKSTVPVETADKIKDIIISHQRKPIKFDLVSNPEFLREGEALNDFMIPDRIVIGIENGKAKDIMLALYKSIERTGRPILITDIKSAELIKYASNAMLATRISFMNQLSELCEKVNADVKLVSKGIGLDSRIGSRFLQAGAGYGGSCFPKDVKSMIFTLREYGCNASLLEAVEEINQNQKLRIVEKVKSFFPTLIGKKIAVWGLAFKPKTDDMRDAPSLIIIPRLQSLGAEIMVFDSLAEHNAKKLFKNLKYAKNPYDAIKGADLLLILTEWDYFRELDKIKLRNLMKKPNIVDARNIYEPDEMKRLGFNYEGVGR